MGTPKDHFAPQHWGGGAQFRALGRILGKRSKISLLGTLRLAFTTDR